MPKEVSINFPDPKEWMNEKFVPLLDCKDRWMILYGSRASSKSTFVAQMLVLRCLSMPFFRCLSLRLVADSIKESSYRQICDVIETMGVSKLFKMTVSPLKIECLNGNYIIFNGLDHPEKLKSMSDITCLHWEEDIPETYTQYVTVSNSLRTMKADYIQEIFSINPVIPDYRNNWFWQMFFDGETNKSFRKEFISEDRVTGKKTTQYATIHHSTWRDNRFLPDTYALQMEMLSRDQWTYMTNNLGLWADKTNGGNFYKKFDAIKNIKNVDYHPELPLFVSIDFNVKPWFSILIGQIVDKELYIIDEMPIKHPNNYTREAIKIFAKKYKTHQGRIFVTGDAAGYQRDTSQEKGYDNWKIVFEELSNFNIVDKTVKQNPSVEMRGQFMNSVFGDTYNGINISINSNCVNLINDLSLGGEAPDGTKLKQRVKDKETGDIYEKYHHFSDCLDYMVVSIFTEDYTAYKNPNKFDPIFLPRIHKNAW